MTQNKEKIPNNMVLPKSHLVCMGGIFQFCLELYPIVVTRRVKAYLKYAKKVDKIKTSFKMREFLT
jgi:hypothetical protein